MHPLRGTTTVLSIAPMMDRTDRHFRCFMRQLTRRTLLYTEMVTAHAVLHGDCERLLGFDPIEHPVALQLGGDEPQALAEAARIGEAFGYDEINLNVGCPSDRVQRGSFGACLMLEPARVAECVRAMREGVAVPVTVKHRLGVDDRDSYEHLTQFVRIVAEAGCDRFTVHARKAWLSGLSPKQNREIPPLRHDWVHRLKRDLPHLPIEINGGFRSLDDVVDQLAHVDAVMVGRASYERPFAFVDTDARLFGQRAPCRTRLDAVQGYAPYVGRAIAQGHPAARVLQPMHELFAGVRGTRQWKRLLDSVARTPSGAGPRLVDGCRQLEARA